MESVNRKRSVTADMVKHLPAPVQRYMNYTGVVGKPWIDTVRVKYNGEFRLGADKPWMPISANQVYTTNPPSFRWKARFKMFGLPLLMGQDTYKDGQGHMFGKLAGLFTVFDARGEELLQGTMLRYLQEMMWFPIAYLDKKYVSWQAVDDHTADVTFSDSGRSVTGRVFFDDEGRILTFIAQRYYEDQGDYSLKTWATPIVEYGTHAGLNLPISGWGVWQPSEGDLPYIKIRIAKIVYNEPIEAF